MTEKELRHLNRKELLEILIDQTKEITALTEKVRELESELSDRRIIIAESGSLAEASIKLNGLFADADKAAEQYLENARLIEEESRRVLEEAHAKAEKIAAEAEENRSAKIKEADLYVDRVKETVQDYLREHPELKRIADEKK